MKKIITFFFILGSLTVLGQGNDEIVIVGTVDRKVEPAYRITENPTIIDTTISAFIMEYPLLVFLLIALLGGIWHFGVDLSVLGFVGHVIAGSAWAIFHILVILLQAFIFMMLTLVYIGQAHSHH